jgi:serine/threonine-protein kinase HipA
MPQDKTTILVYAHWQGMEAPLLMGELTAWETRGHLTWSFSYHPDWLESTPQQVLDPDLQWFSGSQYTPNTKSNFGVFLDSMPDRWGRTLMQKREALLGDQKRLTEVDYLLGVYDPARIGGLRFKTDPDGPFLDDDSQ